MEKLKSFLEKNNIEFITNFDVSQISAIRLGGTLDLAIFPKNIDELSLVLSKLNKSKKHFNGIGNASNVLFTERIKFPVVITNKMCDEIEIKENVVKVSAGMLISRFCDILRKNKLSGFEGIVGIPATIGGAIMCNASAFGYSISDKLKSITVFSKGKIFDIEKKEIHFGHHYSNLGGLIILSATFLFEFKNEYDIISLCNEFTFKRTSSQPGGFSLGSVFKQVNGKSAGFYIERAGLKNERVGGIVISSKHANFFINDKSGSVIDFLRLLAITQNIVDKQFGVSLVPEIEKVGDKDETFGRFSYTFKK